MWVIKIHGLVNISFDDKRNASVNQFPSTNWRIKTAIVAIIKGKAADLISNFILAR